MLLMTSSMQVWIITYISSLCSIDKLSFAPSSIFSFLLYSQYLLLFPNKSRICVLDLATPFTSIIYPSVAS